MNNLKDTIAKLTETIEAKAMTPKERGTLERMANFLDYHEAEQKARINRIKYEMEEADRRQREALAAQATQTDPSKEYRPLSMNRGNWWSRNWPWFLIVPAVIVIALWVFRPSWF